MLKKIVLLLLIIFSSCSKKTEDKFIILEEHKSTTLFLLKERVSKKEIIQIASNFISKPQNKNKISICFFLNKQKYETAFAIVYFLNSKINNVIYSFDQVKFDAFFKLKFKDSILNHWEIKNSSLPRQIILFKKNKQLFYKSLLLDFNSKNLYKEYINSIISIDTLANNEIKFYLKKKESLGYYKIDLDKNLNYFYKNKCVEKIKKRQ
ncbi:MAG: hypothetical protein ACOVMH_10385 [Flavobacterium sp.]